MSIEHDISSRCKRNARVRRLRVVVAVFDSPGEAQPAIEALTSSTRPYAVQTHQGRLDTLDLPDAGTQVPFYWAVALVAGGLIFAIFGAVGSAFVPEVALSPAEGALLGAVTGVFIGYITVLMSGSRDAHREVQELERVVDEGRVLLTVQVQGLRNAGEVVGTLRQNGGDEVRVL